MFSEHFAMQAPDEVTSGLSQQSQAQDRTSQTGQIGCANALPKSIKDCIVPARPAAAPSFPVGETDPPIVETPLMVLPTILAIAAAIAPAFFPHIGPPSLGNAAPQRVWQRAPEGS